MRDIYRISGLINDYFVRRGLVWPDAKDAILFSQTEVTEAIELLMAKDGGWVRNNPDGKEPYSTDRFGEELGDAIMMLLIAGLGVGVNPLASMIEKINRKMEELGND